MTNGYKISLMGLQIYFGIMETVLNLFLILKTLLVNTKCKQNARVITSIKKEFLKIETLLINNVCIYLNPKAFTTTTTPAGIGIVKIKSFTI